VTRRPHAAQTAPAERVAEARRHEHRCSPAGYLPCVVVGFERLGEMDLTDALEFARSQPHDIELLDVRTLGDVERCEAAPTAEPSGERVVVVVVDDGRQAEWSF
jgi:hypothetical protein